MERRIASASRMFEKWGLGKRLFLSPFFSHVRFDEKSIAAIRQAAAAGHTLVYVMKTASLIDYLIFNYLFLKHGLPLARWVNIVKPWLFSGLVRPWMALRRRLFLLRHSSGETRQEGDRPILRQELDKGSAVFYFLQRTGPYLAPPEKTADALFLDLCQRTCGGRPVTLIPLLILWGREAGARRKTFIDLLFGDVDAPGRLRKLFIFLRNFHFARARCGRPVELPPAEAEAAPAEVLAQRLRRLISLQIAAEKKSALGPRTRPLWQTIELILRDPELRQFIERTARKEKVDVAAVEKRARRHLRHLAANYMPLHTALLNGAFTFVWRRLYDLYRFDSEELEKVREVARRGPVVLVPCHRSHIDYLLISSIFFENDLMPPHIAAGENLAFWPLGYFFRRAGAFFIRRAIGANPLYTKILQTYIQRLLRDGLSMEVFIEGGRSRTGRMAPPRMGLVSMQIEAYCAGACEEINYIPVSLNYDLVIEDDALARELSGEKKKRESLGELLKLNKIFGRRYGKAHIRFGEPISLRAFLGTPPGRPLPAKEKRQVIHRLGHLLTEKIAEKTTVTATALAATVLLSPPPRHLSADEVLEEAADYLDWLRFSGRILSRGLRLHPESSLPKGLRHLCASRLVEGRREGGEERFAIEPWRRLPASYYRNNLAFQLMPLGLFSLFLLREGTLDLPALPASDDFRLAYRILAHEYLAPQTMPGDWLSEPLAWLTARAWARPRGAQVENLAARLLLPFADLPLACLEPYRLTAESLSLRRRPYRNLPHAVLRLMQYGERKLQEGDFFHPEVNTTWAYESALNYLFEEEIVHSGLVIRSAPELSDGESAELSRQGLEKLLSGMERLTSIRRYWRSC